MISSPIIQLFEYELLLPDTGIMLCVVPYEWRIQSEMPTD